MVLNLKNTTMKTQDEINDFNFQLAKLNPFILDKKK